MTQLQQQAAEGDHHHQRLVATAAEADEIAALLAQRGIQVPRSQPLAKVIGGLLAELEGIQRALTLAVMRSDSGALAATRAELEVLGQGTHLYRYENPTAGLTVFSMIEASEDKRTCLACGQRTPVAPVVCLQCGQDDRDLQPESEAQRMRGVDR